jgi:hypothetical protein
MLQFPPMSIDGIIKELQEERNRIDRAIQALVGVRSGSFPGKLQTKSVSPTTRRKIAAAQRARWAKRASQGTAKPKRKMSAAGRRRIAAAQRARWAKVKAGKK